MIQLIIFDWDDVITLGSKEGYFQCYHETLLELGIRLSHKEEEKRILAKWGKPHRQELKELLKENPQLLEEACLIYEQKLFGETYIKHLKAVKGVRQLLKRLSGQYILCVATGLNPRILKEKIIPKFGFPNVFSQIISSYDIEDPKKQKPHPYAAKKILQDQKVSSSQAVLVGDSASDVRMAQAAGIKPIVVLTGHLNGSQARQLGVEHILNDVTEIEALLSKLDK